MSLFATPQMIDVPEFSTPFCVQTTLHLKHSRILAGRLHEANALYADGWLFAPGVQQVDGTAYMTQTESALIALNVKTGSYVVVPLSEIASMEGFVDAQTTPDAQGFVNLSLA